MPGSQGVNIFQQTSSSAACSATLSVATSQTLAASLPTTHPAAGVSLPTEARMAALVSGLVGNSEAMGNQTRSRHTPPVNDLLREVQAAKEGLEAGVAVGWSPAQLSQLGVFGFGFLQEGNVRVGVFPEVQELFIRGSAHKCVASKGVSPCQAEVRQRIVW